MFFGRFVAVHAARQEALDAAHARHPERFPNGPPKAALPPAKVHINPLEALTVLVTYAESAGVAASINAPMITDAPSEPKTQKALHAVARTPRHEAPPAETATLPS